MDSLIKGETLKVETITPFYMADKNSRIANLVKELKKEAALNGYISEFVLKNRTHKFGKDKVISRVVGVGYSDN